MILVVAIMLSMLAAWLRGGRLSTLGSLSLRWGALAVAGFVVQTAFIYQKPLHKVIGRWGWQEAVFMGSYLLVLATIWANCSVKGIKIVGLGLLLNFLVMTVNGGWMPVTPEAITAVGYTHLAPSLASGTRVYSSKDVILLREETRLWYLSDVLVLPRPFPVPSVCSVGDAVVALGVFVLIQDGMLRYRERT
jgi:hypothetical protein